jgi:phage-related protein
VADGKVKIDIEADSSDFKDEVNDLGDEAKKAADGVDDLGDSAKDAGKGLDALDVAAGAFVANALTGLISKLGEGVASLLELSESTREYRDDMAKLETAFSSAGHSTDTASKAYEDFYAILGESDRSVEAVNHLAELTKNEQEVAKWSTIAAGVTAKFGDSLPIEGLTEAANETAKVGAVTGAVADALNWAGISEDEFNKKLEKCNSEQERATLITNTLNDLYSDAAAEYNELTASTQDARRATSEMEAAQAELGAAIEPVTTAWTKLKTQALQWLVDTGLPAAKAGWEWIKNNIPVVATAVGGLTAAFVAFKVAQLAATAATEGMTIAQYAATAVQKLLNATMLANPISLIIIAITALVAAFIYLWNNCEAFREFWIGLWEKIKSIASSVGEWLRTFFTETIPQFFSNLFTSIGEFFSNIWSSVSEFFTSLFTSIGEFFTKIYNALVAFFNDPFYYIGYALGYIFGLIAEWAQKAWDFLTETVPQIIADVIAFISELPGKIWEWLLATIKKVVEWDANMKQKAREAASNFLNQAVTTIKELPGKIWEWLTQTIAKAKEFASDLGRKGLEAAQELITNIVEGAKELPEKMLEIGKNVVSGVWKGIVAAKDQFFANVKSFFSGLVDGAKAELDIQSPSRKFAYIGEMSVEGLGKGWADNIPDVEKQLTGDLSGLTARVQASVNAESARAGRSMGRAETGFTDLARAVGMQTAGINSLSASYRRGAGSMRPVVLELNGRELGRAMVDVGGAEETRTGLKLSYGGAY